MSKTFGNAFSKNKTFALSLTVLVIAFFAVILAGIAEKPPRYQHITGRLLDERMRLIGQWVSENQREDGSFPYLYDPDKNEYSSKDYAIRQILAVQGFFAVGKTLRDESILSAAARGEAYLMNDMYREDPRRGFAYIFDTYHKDIRLGAAAVAILMLREGKADDAPLSREERYLGEFILSMQRDNGGFQTFLQDTPTQRDERFYSGEALAALALLAHRERDPRYERALQKGLHYYRNILAADFLPPYAPWHMMAYAIAYRDAPKEEYAAYVFSLADTLIETMLTADEEARGDEIGRFYNPRRPEWGLPHSASTGIYTEGLTYAYEVAVLRGDAERIKRYREAIFSGTRSLLSVQWTRKTARGILHPARVVGAFRRTTVRTDTRIDQLGHAANALARVRHVMFE